MTSIEAEYSQITEATYQNIKEKSEAQAIENSYSLNEAKKIKNRIFNRYRDVNPYDHSRIILQKSVGTDYINANLVKMDRANRQYILCQGPLEITVSHFWLMVWEQQSKAILMLNKIIEKKAIKCHMYWPAKIGPEHKLDLKDAGLKITYLTCENYKNFSKRVFRVTDTESGKSRDVLQFHYMTWPDFGVPTSPIAFLQFLKQVRDSGALDEDAGPPVIHCSAGIGRSGTFCVVDCCLVLINKEGENRVSVQDVLLELRKYRMGLIQTYDQLTFSYEAIIEGMKRMNDDTFHELDNLEVASAEECIEEMISPPPLPPRHESLPMKRPATDEILNEEQILEQIKNKMNSEKTSRNRPLPPLPPVGAIILDPVDELIISDSDTSDDEDELDTDSEISEKELSDYENEEVINHHFDADGSLPPLPNGTMDLNSDKPMSSSDGEMSPVRADGLGNNSELRHRKRADRQFVMAEKIREIKRKQKEVEDKKISSPKKRRSFFIIVTGVFLSAIVTFVYLKS